MKIPARDIEGVVKRPESHNAIFLYGPDEGLVRHRSQMIIDTWLGSEADPMSRLTLTGDQLKEDPARLFDELQAMSLMGDKRVIILRDPAEANAGDLDEAYNIASPDNRLIVLAGDLTPKSSLRKGAESHASCPALACYKDEGRGLESLIRDTLTGFGLQVQPEAFAYLTGHLNGDRMIVLGELEKLSLYMGEEETVTLEIVQSVIGEQSEKSYDDLCYAVSGGDITQAMRLLDRLWQQGEVPVTLLRALQRHFMRFQELEALSAQGMRGEAAVKQLRPPVFFKYQRVVANHASRWQGRKLASAMQILQKTEADCKGTVQAVELLCSQALLQLAKAA